METPFKPLEQTIGVFFQNKELLKNVFIHRSFLNEHNDAAIISNEKLEFLGDSVLSLATSMYLYDQYPLLQEGDFTDIKAAIVRTESLAEVAETLELGNYLFLSHGEEKGGGRTKTNILADVCEALIAAIFLDQGFDKAYQFIERFLFKTKLDHIIKNKLYLSPKSRLQEITQAIYKDLPVYELEEASGPEHKKTFMVNVRINGDLKGKGVGKSKKQAEEHAAQIALELLQK